jgi:hypothetical protein
VHINHFLYAKVCRNLKKILPSPGKFKVKSRFSCFEFCMSVNELIVIWFVISVIISQKKYISLRWDTQNINSLIINEVFFSQPYFVPLHYNFCGKDQEQNLWMYIFLSSTCATWGVCLLSIIVRLTMISTSCEAHEFLYTRPTHDFYPC